MFFTSNTLISPAIQCYFLFISVGIIHGLFDISNRNIYSGSKKRIGTSVIFILCLISIFIDNRDSHSTTSHLPQLLNTTFTHKLIFNILAEMHSYNCTLAIHSIIYQPYIYRSCSTFVHDCLTLVGMLLLLIIEMGGGMTIYLLLDSSTFLFWEFFIISVRKKLNQNIYRTRMELLMGFYYIFYFVIRIEWYNFIILKTFLEIYSVYQMSDVLGIQLYIFMGACVFWLVFAMVFHGSYLYASVRRSRRIRDILFAKHYFVTFCLIVFPIIFMIFG